MRTGPSPRTSLQADAHEAENINAATEVNLRKDRDTKLHNYHRNQLDETLDAHAEVGKQELQADINLG